MKRTARNDPRHAPPKTDARPLGGVPRFRDLVEKLRFSLPRIDHAALLQVVVRGQLDDIRNLRDVLLVYAVILEIFERECPAPPEPTEELVWGVMMPIPRFKPPDWQTASSKEVRDLIASISARLPTGSEAPDTAKRL